MESVVLVLSSIMAFSRPVLFAAGVLAAIACAISWAARSRRLSPFSALSRFSRERIDPLLSGIEAPVRNAGGSAESVPWWGLAAFLVLGLVLQSLLGYVTDLVVSTTLGLASGPRGAVRAVLQLLLSLVQIALLIRVISSWIPALQRVRWLRWTHSLTEPLLRPLRAVLPNLGPFDLSPLVLYYLLSFVGGAIVGMV